MNERDFLNKIRKMQESGQSIKLTEMKDIDTNSGDKRTKLMENIYKFPIITEDNTKEESRRLFENEEGVMEIEKEDGQDISPDEQRDEENTFKDTVTQLVEFNKIKVYKKNVEWSGRLVRERINWVYSLEEQVGCYISTDSDDIIQLTDDVLDVVKKVRAYYDIWSDEWSRRLVGSPTGEVGGESGGF